jgi:hypothetical protein
MNWKLGASIGIGFLFLAYGTVAVFLAIDRNSHSVSDTLRPFIITMAPVWALSVGAAYVLLSRRTP